MNKIVFSFGRMNPLTIGHGKLIDKVNEVAKKESASVRVYLSHTQNKKKDPLSYEDKIKFATKAFGKSMFKSKCKTIIQVLQELETDKFTDIIMVVGSDRVTEFDRLIQKYNGKDYNFASIEIRSAGERDPDSNDVAGMSASKMRQFVLDDDYDAFKKGLPKKLSEDDAKYLFNTIGKNLGKVNLLECINDTFEDYLITYGLL